MKQDTHTVDIQLYHIMFYTYSVDDPKISAFGLSGTARGSFDIHKRPDVNPATTQHCKVRNLRLYL